MKSSIRYLGSLESLILSLRPQLQHLPLLILGIMMMPQLIMITLNHHHQQQQSHPTLDFPAWREFPDQSYDSLPK